MKKFIFGLTCGIALTVTTTVYAADSIQAYLFPVKFVIDGETKNPKDAGYETINYNGSTYVPIRFIAESMGTKIAYEDATKTITVDSGFKIIDINNSGVTAGHLSVDKEGNHSVIKGKLYIGRDAWDYKFIEGYQSMTRYYDPTKDVTRTSATGNLAFWNDKGEIMERVPYEVINIPTLSEQIVSFKKTSQTDVSGYATVTLESHDPTPSRLYGFSTPTLIYDAENKVSFGLVDLVKTGEYTIIRGLLGAVNPSNVSNDSPIRISFLDNKGNHLGTAITTLGADKPKAQLPFAVFLGKGDFTNYKSLTIEVGK